MSSTQLILAVLVILAFGLGWWARGRRAEGVGGSDGGSSGPTEALDCAARLDLAVAAALTSFQAALALWQIEGKDPAPDRVALTHRAIGACTKAGARVRETRPTPRSGRDVAVAHRRAVHAVNVLGEELSAHTPGVPLGIERERRLVSAERMLAAARFRLLSTLSDERVP